MSSSEFRLKVISGGQSGADQAALLAARQSKLATGGWAPKGYLTTEGPALWLHDYGLIEMSTDNYVVRSIKNVQDSDGMVAFRTHPSSGTDKTIGYALTKKWQVVRATPATTPYKPVLVIPTLSEAYQKALVEFIKTHNIKVLNVCGHREVDPVAKKWTYDVGKFLESVFANL